MIDVAGARAAIADAVTQAGIDCFPYAPDSPIPPCGFVDDVALELLDTFCLNARGTFTLLLVEQRNDKAEGLANIEAALPTVLANLTAVSGLVVTAIQSGAIQAGGLEMPAVSITVRADL